MNARPSVKWYASSCALDSKNLLELTKSSSSLGLKYISSVELSRLNFREFPIFKRAIFLPPLLDCMDKLCVLKSFLNVERLEDVMVYFEYRSPEERYSMKSANQKRLKQEKYEGLCPTDRQKLRSDIQFIIATLLDCCWELHHRGEYTRIISTLKAALMEMEDDSVIEEQRKQHTSELHMLLTTTVQERKEHEEDLKAATLKMHVLVDACEDYIGYANVEKKYTKNWETARQNLNNLSLDKQEEVYTDCIAKHNNKIDYENRIHTELENYITENVEDLQTAIMFWMQKYDEEIEERDAEILKLKIIYEQLLEDHRVLKEEYEKRCIEIEDFLTYKENKRIAEEIEQARIRAIIKIQAWWRGTMVRKQLGPFSPQKPAKKGGKKDDKKKKK